MTACNKPFNLFNPEPVIQIGRYNHSTNLNIFTDSLFHKGQIILYVCNLHISLLIFSVSDEIYNRHRQRHTKYVELTSWKYGYTIFISKGFGKQVTGSEKITFLLIKERTFEKVIEEFLEKRLQLLRFDLKGIEIRERIQKSVVWIRIFL